MKTFFSTAFFTVLFLVGMSGRVQAQFIPPNQPEQDACGALQTCGIPFFTPYSYSGYGSKLEQIQSVGYSPFPFIESNSVWFKVQIASPGLLAFVITPVITTQDYDFSVYNITGKTCDSININTLVRTDGCDFASAAPTGKVGLRPSSPGVFATAGASPPFISAINAQAGDTYLILVDSYLPVTASGFTLSFDSSTATFVAPPGPLLDTIAKDCYYKTGLTFHTTKNVKCSSLQTNGSDFYITPALTTVTSATGVNCSGTNSANGYSNSISITFSNPLPSGNYWLHVKNGTDNNTLLDLCGTPIPLTDSIPFTVTNPIVRLGPDTTTCIHNSIQLNAAVTGLPAGVTVASYSWTPTTYLSSGSIANPVATPTTDVTYVVTVTPSNNANCIAKDTINVAVLHGFYLANHDTAICKGAAVTLNAVGDPRYTYIWTPTTYLSNGTGPATNSTPDTTITYTVIARKTGCADSSNKVTIDVQPVPTVYIGPDVTVCYGDTLNITASVLPTWYTGYMYSYTPATSLNFGNIANPVFTATDTTHLTLTVTTGAGCTGMDDRYIYVVPNKFASISADTGICPGDSAVLRVSGGISYVFSPNRWISDTTSANPTVRPVTTTEYVVRATSATGCRDTESVLVTVHPTALVNLPDSVKLFPGDSYTMDPGGNCLYFSWFPPLGLSNANISNPVAMPEVNTRYYITATTESGCVAHDSIVVLVDPESSIDMPNAFTPAAGDGANNILKPVHNGAVTLNYLRLFDRWGNKVFESHDINEGWNGQYNGQPQPLGVYIYMIQATLPSGRVFTKQGNVTLLR